LLSFAAMRVEKQQEGSVVVAWLAGEFDRPAAALLEETLIPLAAPGSVVVLELEQVEAISSGGVRALLLLNREVGARQARLLLAGLPEMVAEQMSNTGFLDFFEIVEQWPADLAALNGHRAGVELIGGDG